MVKTSTTIAAVVLGPGEDIRLHDLADEILASRIADRSSARAVSWDCEDLVFLDFDGLRIALQHCDCDELEDSPAIICVAVGPVPGCGLAQSMDCAQLAQSLVRRLTRMVQAAAVLWQDHRGALTAETMDMFQDALTDMLDYLEMQLAEASASALVPERCAAFDDKPEAGKAASSLLSDEAAFAALRQTLIGQASGAKITTPIHASLYLMACTFFFLVPAIGTTLLSYVALRDGLDFTEKTS